MGKCRTPLVDYIFLYSYEMEFMQYLLSVGKKQHLGSIYVAYLDDALSINNPEFVKYFGQMCPVDLEINDSTESNTSASYLDLICRGGETVNFTLPFIKNATIYIPANFPLLCSNISICYFHITAYTICLGLLL